MKPFLIAALLVVPILGCSQGAELLERPRPIAEVEHTGFRDDIPDERRGNAVFFRAVFTREGTYLVTFGSGGFRIWNPNDGTLLRTITGTLDGNDAVIADGTHHRLLARRGDVAPTDPLAYGLGIWDLKDGSQVGIIPETDKGRAIPVGIANNEAIVIRDRLIETWALDGSGRRLVVAPPEGLRFCERGIAASSYNDKQCFELSPSGRLLAVTAWNPGDHRSPTRPFLVDLASGQLSPIVSGDASLDDGVQSFAFSSDERTLAMGTRAGMLLRPVNPDAEGGTFIKGEHKRGQSLTPMAFAAGDTRIVALGDQLQVSSFDTRTGALVGRAEPPFEDFEGALRVAADGSRAVAYRFVSDILVVIDGAMGKERGYVCPFFCNKLHQPVEVPYAVSPDGRRVASGGRLGAGLWNTDADTLIAPLEDPKLPPRRPR